MTSTLIIPITLNDKTVIDFKIFSEYSNSLFTVDANEAQLNGEAQYQLQEGCFYEYCLPSGYCLEVSDIVRESRINRSNGRIIPNVYVGSFRIAIKKIDSNIQCGELSLEIRSFKTSYRNDYRSMLLDISERCTELLMQYNSPVSQIVEVDFGQDSRILYQRFVFVKSLIENEEFKESIHKIISSPTTSWAESVKDRDIRGVRRINSRSIKQIAKNSNRIYIPNNNPLKKRLSDVPRTIQANYKTDTIDNPENRFIKYALSSFQLFCADFINRTPIGTKINIEAKDLEARIEQHLAHTIFKSISSTDSLPLNSPVLHRKEGYREVFKTWLMFDLAAKLVWHGGDDVYDAGKKDVAQLYEYWAFFKLLDSVSEVFQISPKHINSLIEETKNGLGLKLKQGRHLPIQGIYTGATRKFNIELSYNKTFSGSSSYPEGGSWTRSLRPDYTLSIWPYEVSQSQAEIEELIVHLHFDAKYKIDNITSIFNSVDSLDEERLEQKHGSYKRADLLKMHTYRDAIRRTAGAYILYPGSELVSRKGFHELLPGVGAFTLVPSKADDGTSDLKKFLRDILDHFLNRISQRETMSFRTYEVHKEQTKVSLNAHLPETFGKNRNLLPDNTYVLIAYYKSKEHYDWIIKNGLYNARLEGGRGSLPLGPNQVGAKYLLLHSKGSTTTGDIFSIQQNPTILSKQDLVDMAYPGEPSREFYLAYRVEAVREMEFRNKSWRVNILDEFITGRGSPIPFVVSITELMKVLSK